MKQTRASFRLRTFAAWTFLLSVVFLAGCSEATDESRNDANTKYGLEPSEFMALKKAGTSRGDFEKEQIKRKIEQMKERGVAVETTTSRKKSGQPR